MTSTLAETLANAASPCTKNHNSEGIPSEMPAEHTGDYQRDVRKKISAEAENAVAKKQIQKADMAFLV